MFKKDNNYLEINDGNRSIAFYRTRYYRTSMSSCSVGTWHCLISEIEYNILYNLSEDDDFQRDEIINEIILRETDADRQSAYAKIYDNVVKKIAEKKNIVDEMVNSIKLD